MPPNLNFIDISKKPSYVVGTISASYHVQNLRSGFKLAFWETVKPNSNKQTFFPNSVSFMIFHNQIISNPSGQRKIKIPQKFPTNSPPPLISARALFWNLSGLTALIPRSPASFNMPLVCGKTYFLLSLSQTH